MVYQQNVWKSQNFPFLSQLLFYENGTEYNQLLILNDDFTLNTTKLAEQGLPYYAGVALAGLQLARILRSTDFDSRASCWAGFKGCGWAGVWVWAGATVDYIMMLGGLSVPVGLAGWW